MKNPIKKADNKAAVKSSVNENRQKNSWFCEVLYEEMGITAAHAFSVRFRKLLTKGGYNNERRKLQYITTLK